MYLANEQGIRIHNYDCLISTKGLSWNYVTSLLELPNTTRSHVDGQKPTCCIPGAYFIEAHTVYQLSVRTESVRPGFDPQYSMPLSKALNFKSLSLFRVGL